MEVSTAIIAMSLAMAVPALWAEQVPATLVSESRSRTTSELSIASTQMVRLRNPAGAAVTVANTVRSNTRDLPVGRVRPRDVLSRYLVEQGRTRSATFDRLFEALSHADVVVYIDVEPEPAQAPSGQLQFITAGGGLRYVQITVRPDTTSWHGILSRHVELVAILGHELQHAAEIAISPEVADSSTFAALYARVGTALYGGAFDTVAAQLTGTRIRAELMEPRESASDHTGAP